MDQRTKVLVNDKRLTDYEWETIKDKRKLLLVLVLTISE